MEVNFKFASGQTYNPSPFHVVVVGHFSGAESGKGDAPDGLTTATLDEALARTVGTLRYSCANHLGSGKELDVEFKVESFKDLTPGGVAAKVPELAAINGLIERIEEVSRGKITREAFGQWADANLPGMSALHEAVRLCMGADLGAAGSAPAAGGDAPAEGGGSLLDQIVDAKPGDAPKSSSALGGIISSIGSGGSAVTAEFKQAKEKAAAVLSKQLDAVLKHETFRTVERSWRSLKFLAGKMDFREGNVTLKIVDAPRSELLHRFDTVLHKPVYTGHQPTPGLVVVDAEFTSSPADMELLQTLAERGESVQMGIVTGIGHNFFPDRTVAAAARLPDPGNLFRETAFEKWNSIREKDCARWLAVAANRFILRDPWTPESARGVEYTERIEGPGDVMWGNAAYMVAAACARSFGKEKWPTEITGYEAGRFDGMTLRDSEGAGSAKIPTEALLSEDQAKGLYDNGLVALVVEPNRDSIFIMRAPTVLLPVRTDNDHANVVNRRMAQFPYQLLAARLSEEVFHHKMELVGDRELKTVHDNFEAFLGAMFSGTGDGAGIAVSVDPDPEDKDSGKLLVQLRVRTGKKILKSVDMTLGFYV